MVEQVVCPRCGARGSFGKGYLPETCVCRICQSQLDWREIPGCGPDCAAAREPEAPAEPATSQPGGKDAPPPTAGKKASKTDAGGADA
jgi:hypothetical protein